jgi:hypothetical protein
MANVPCFVLQLHDLHIYKFEVDQGPHTEQQCLGEKLDTMHIGTTSENPVLSIQTRSVFSLNMCNSSSRKAGASGRLGKTSKGSCVSLLYQRCHCQVSIAVCDTHGHCFKTPTNISKVPPRILTLSRLDNKRMAQFLRSTRGVEIKSPQQVPWTKTSGGRNKSSSPNTEFGEQKTSSQSRAEL